MYGGTADSLGEEPSEELAEALWAELVNDAPAYAEFQKNLAWVKEALAAL